ncbi:hypothetical protein QBC46DRAFT_260921 [Diplogelasinospora grovesii]|uniref:Uncharacterized protein n=1 Tax=Diplogelasinospora grovesii TaxID=303347 RepID=A0AAN6N745_9PEZI|nr:hypothetical protein QBC46DRAFT_260921 [Diplogelasinospora grovesii]
MAAGIPGSGTSDSGCPSSGVADSAAPGPAPPGRVPLRPTNSAYYDFKGTPWNRRIPGAQSWMYASEVEAQVLDAPNPRKDLRYPDPFENHSTSDGTNLPLQASTPILHHPLVPGQTTAWKGGRPGAVRAFYNNKNRQVFDVGYHDKNAPRTKSGKEGFTMADYIPAAPPSPPPGDAVDNRESGDQATGP